MRNQQNIQNSNISNLGNSISSINNNIDEMYKLPFHACLPNHATLLEKNVDLNTLTKPGVYFCNLNLNAQTYKNTPFNQYNVPKAFIMEVYGSIVHGGYENHQKLYVYESNWNGTDYYIRYFIWNAERTQATFQDWIANMTNKKEYHHRTSIILGNPDTSIAPYFYAELEYMVLYRTVYVTIRNLRTGTNANNRYGIELFNQLPKASMTAHAPLNYNSGTISIFGGEKILWCDIFNTAFPVNTGNFASFSYITSEIF